MAAEDKLGKLTLEIVSASNGERVDVPGFVDGRLEVQFNPTEYTIERETSFAEVAIPGLDAPVLQYVRGGGDKLSLELFLDVTDSMEDGMVKDGLGVRERLLAPLERLMMQHEKLHAPPVIAARWGGTTLVASAVATALSVKYTLFDVMGRAVRATATLSLREFAPATRQIAEAGLQSPDRTNVATVRAGDTLPAIALREYGDASRWRPIAEANGLGNPLAIRVGQRLIVPRVI